MSEVSLYRKYRPQNFNNLVGQDHIRTTLLNAIKSGNPSHAYLFCGPRGTGKTSTARLLAKALNCLDPGEDGEPCDKCEICVPIREGNLIDMVEIDAASNRGIDEIRDLKDKINFAPTRAKTKVYIIDEVHMLTKEAFNALLKTLEEPPSHVFFVLATTEVHKIPETIISRCQRFDFKRITKKGIAARLMYIAQLENIDVEQEAINTIAHISEGGMRDAIGLIEQLSVNGKLTFDRVKEVLGISGQSAIETLYKHIGACDTKSALNEIQNLYSEGTDLMQFTKDFLEFLRLEMLAAIETNKLQDVPYILMVIDNFQDAYNKLKVTTIPQLPLEIATLKVIANLPENIQIPVQEPKANVNVVEKVKIIEVEELLNDSMDEPRIEPKIEPKVEIEIETKVEEPIATTENKIALTISYVKENWARVIELIKTPFVRLSLKEGKPISLENGILKIGFASNFHKEKVEATEAKFEIENAFNEIFEGPIHLEFEVNQVALEPSQEYDAAPQAEQTDQQEDAADSDLINHALELFGGEFVED
ncbi:DNA polymerase III subunit gamma/tau [Patescibacteria group bacterium]|nr:DNA polymerase III subunit gamma/tau [Patescibacteria group bacterium]